MTKRRRPFPSAATLTTTTATLNDDDGSLSAGFAAAAATDDDDAPLVDPALSEFPFAQTVILRSRTVTGCLVLVFDTVAQCNEFVHLMTALKTY